MAGDRAFRNVAALREAVRDATYGLEYSPKFLRITLVEGTWKRFTAPDGRLIRHDDFERFVVTQPYEGLGVTIDAMRKIVSPHKELSAMFEKALAGKAVAKPRDYRSAVQQTLFVPSSTRMQLDLDRLQHTSRAIYAKVMRGDISLYEGMIEAGLRDRTLTVRPADIDSTARALRNRLSAPQLAQLKKLL